ncbi:MAG: hypothetical protein ACXWNE_12305, partial [Candidatus Binataceae bacterium]
HRTSKPFRVALPAYGSRVSWREDGSLLAIEGEMPLLAGGSSAIELTNGLDDEYGENWWEQGGGFRSRP